MDYLIELATRLQQNLAKSNAHWDAFLESDPKARQLFDLAAQGRVQSDEEAAAVLFGKPVVSQAYVKLKNKLKDRLVKSFLLLDSKGAEGNDRQAVYIDCNQKWAAAQVLLTNNAKRNGIDILEKLLRRTLRFEFTELSLAILRILRLHYATVEGDQKKFEQANRQYQELRVLWERENRAEELYTSLAINHVHDKSGKAGVSELALKYFHEVEPWMQESGAFKLNLMGRLIRIAIYTSVNNYKQTAELCEEAIEFFRNKDYDSGLPLQVFYYQLAVCYIQLREFEKGQELLESRHEVFQPGSFNWFKFKELFFLQAMHTESYSEGIKVCEEMLRHPKLSIQPAHVTETWRIYDGYCNLLIRLGKVAWANDGEKASKFRRQKFLNDIPLYSRDKRGMNIPILILQIMFLLADRDYSALTDRVEAIQKYCGRYLKQDDTYRSNVFIKMLMQVPQASFHKEAVLRKTDKLLAMLKAAPIEISNQSHEIEIIPYENLWDMLIEHLNHKFFTSSSVK